MEKYSLDRLRTLIGVVVGFILVLILATCIGRTISKKGRKSAERELVILQPAPTVTLNPEASKLRNFADGTTYYIDENGNIVASFNAQEYWIAPEGTIQDVDGEVINDPEVLAHFVQMLKDDPFAGGYINLDNVSSDLSKAISIADLSDSELASIASTLGVPEEEFLSALEAYRNDPLYKKFKAEGDIDLRTLSPEELTHLAEMLGISEDQLREFMANGGTSLQDFLNQNGLTFEPTVDNVMKMIDSKKQAKKDLDVDRRKVLQDYLKAVGMDTLDPDQLLDQLDLRNISVEDFMKDALKNGINNAMNTVGMGAATLGPNGAPAMGMNDAESYAQYINSLPAPPGYNPMGGAPMGAPQNGYSYDTLNMIPPQAPAQASGNALVGSIMGSGSNPFEGNNYVVMNNQSGKKDFLEEKKVGTKYVKTESDHMLTIGTIINARLLNGVNTDLPGQIVAIVEQNVYDSFTASNILIPKGTKLIATYDSSVTWGQTRVLIGWTNMIRPDGLLVQLNGYSGVDKMGYAGSSGDVNNHVLEIVGATVLSSLINFGAGYAKTATSMDVLRSLIDGGTSGVTNVTEQLLSKYIDLQPTIKILPGTELKVFVNDNFELPVYNMKRANSLNVF